MSLGDIGLRVVGKKGEREKEVLRESILKNEVGYFYY